jgi:serine/threonine-protein kinase
VSLEKTRSEHAHGRRALVACTALLAIAACSGDDDADGPASSAGAGAEARGGETGAGRGGAGGAGRGGAGAAGRGGAGGDAGAGGRSAAGAGGTPVTSDCGNAEHQIFPPGAPWNSPIDAAPLASDSDAIIARLQSVHTDARRFQIDFSLRVLRAGDEAPHRAFEPTADFYDTECDTAPPPVPEGGSLEGEPAYECTSDGDCHLIVLDQDECRLFEMWRANIDGAGTFGGGCLAVWEVDRVYPDTGRGLHCSSADAAGLPIAPLLFTADEVADGAVPHALRFALPNSMIRNGRFVAPGTHATRSASGGDDAPPYAARLRLKADADLGPLSEPARVVAQALQRYGMYLADGGNITFMGLDERDSERRWDDVGLGPHDLKPLQWSDFEVVDSGPAIEWTGDCQRIVVTE